MVARLTAVAAAGLALGLGFPSPAANPPPGYHPTVVSRPGAGPRYTERAPRTTVRPSSDR
jgi:hypothetical protein